MNSEYHRYFIYNFANSFGWHKPIPSIPAMPEPLELTATLPKISARKSENRTIKAALFSRLVPWKKALWLVQQWDFIKDAIGELHIYGSGPEEPLIREYIESSGIGNMVKCFGHYPEGQAYVDLLSGYDLTLLPTVGPEGAPIVLLESMACGVPFVAHGVGGIPQYGVNNPNVMIVPPEHWLTDQAKEYTIATDPKAVPAFIVGVRQMVEKIISGDVNQTQLQEFYFKHYSYAVLKEAWLSYLCY